MNQCLPKTKRWKRTISSVEFVLTRSSSGEGDAVVRLSCLESMPYIYHKHWNVLCLTFQSFFFLLLFYSAQEIQHAPIAEHINTQSASSSVSITFRWLEWFSLPLSHSTRFAKRNWNRRLPWVVLKRWESISKWRCTSTNSEKENIMCVSINVWWSNEYQWLGSLLTFFVLAGEIEQIHQLTRR